MASGRRSEEGMASEVSPLGWLALAFLLGAEPVSAGQLFQSLKDRTLTCAVDAAFYVDASGTHLLAIGFGTDAGTGVAEISMSLTGTALQADQGNRFDLTVPVNGTTTRLRFQRTGKMGAGGGGGVRLLVDADVTGDDCVVERGRAAFDEARFNTIRAGVCGNDPRDACIAALAKVADQGPTRPACGASSQSLSGSTRERGVSRADQVQQLGGARGVRTDPNAGSIIGVCAPEADLGWSPVSGRRFD